MQPTTFQQYGLIGYPLSHSFSQRYFTQKFIELGISNATYEIFELTNIKQFPALIAQHPTLNGLNVTIPYKQQIIPYLDELSAAAAAIGAINTIQFDNGKLIGHNTDVIGFEQSLQHFLPATHTISALLLGTGGASKAVQYVLQKKAIPYQVVSRQAKAGWLTYADLTPAHLSVHPLIINTTPLGTYPAIDTAPEIPYTALSDKNYLFDLVYNPEKTFFLQYGEQHGSTIKNGLEMLYIQAEAAWHIWQATS